MWNRAQAPDSKGSLKSRTMTPVTTADRFYVVSQSVNRLNCRQTCNLSRLRRALCRNHGPLRSIPVWPAIRFPWHLLYHVFYFSLSHKHTGPHTHRVTHTHTHGHTHRVTHTQRVTHRVSHTHTWSHTHTHLLSMQLAHTGNLSVWLYHQSWCCRHPEDRFQLYWPQNYVICIPCRLCQ